MTSLNFQLPNPFSTGQKRIQRRPRGRLQRLAVRQDFPIGKVGDEIIDGDGCFSAHRPTSFCKCSG